MKTKSQKPAVPNHSPSAIGKGTILSETSFYVVQGINPTNGMVDVKDDYGHEIGLSKKYAEEICVSADLWLTEEKKSMTELAELFISSPRIAMTVAYFTKPTEKTKKDYEHEKKAKIDEILNATLANTANLLSELIENPLTKWIPGHLRVMKGRHYGHVDELGRIHFIDMELTRDTSKDYDTRSRQVDPRTIQWLIINKVKYTLK